MLNDAVCFYLKKTWFLDISNNFLYFNFTATDGSLGTRQVFVQVLKTEGVGGFFKGAVPVLARAFPANACCFMGYEAAMYAMKLMGI